MDKKQLVELVREKYKVAINEDSVIFFETKEQLFKYVYTEESTKDELVGLMIKWGNLDKETLTNVKNMMEHILKEHESVFEVNEKWLFCSDWKSFSEEELLMVEKKEIISEARIQYGLSLKEEAVILFSTPEELFNYIYAKNTKKELLEMILQWGKINKESLRDKATFIEHILENHLYVFEINNKWIYCDEWEVTE